MKILLSGYYGFANVGDEAVREAIVQGIKKIDPKAVITVLSLPRYAWGRIFLEMRRTDLFISGGGTLFQNATSRRSFFYYLGLVLLAKFLRKRVVVFAQGFGPLKGFFSRALAKLVLDRVDRISLRDQQSFNELARLGVKKSLMEVCADPSLLLDIPSPSEGRKILGLEQVPLDRPLLGIALRSAKRFEPKALAKAIDHLVEKYRYHPVFILFQCPEDMPAASKVMGMMKSPSSVIFRICRPAEMLSVISQFDLLIGMRLHSLIFAAMCGVPMLGISYDPKVEAFMKEIGQPCLGINLQDIKGILKKIIDNKEAMKSALGDKSKELKVKALRAFEAVSSPHP